MFYVIIDGKKKRVYRDKSGKFFMYVTTRKKKGVQASDLKEEQPTKKVIKTPLDVLNKQYKKIDSRLKRLEEELASGENLCDAKIREIQNELTGEVSPLEKSSIECNNLRSVINQLKENIDECKRGGDYTEATFKRIEDTKRRLYDVISALTRIFRDKRISSTQNAEIEIERIRETIINLQRAVEKIDEMINQFRYEMMGSADKDSTIHELQEIIKTLNRRVMDEMEISSQKLQAKEEDIAIRLTNLNNTIKELRSYNSVLETEITELQKNLETNCRDEISTLRDELLKLQGEKRLLEEELEKQRETHRLDAEYDTNLIIKNEELQKRIDELNERIDVLSKNSGRIDEERVKALSQLSQCRANIDQLNEDKERIRTEISTLESQLVETRTNTVPKDIFNQLERRFADLEAVNKALELEHKSQIEKLSKELERTKVTRTRNGTQPREQLAGDNLATILELTAENEQLRDQLRQLQSIETKAREEGGDLVRRDIEGMIHRREYESVVEQYENRIAELISELENVQSALQERDQECENDKTKLTKEADELRQGLEQRLQDSDSELERIEQENEKLRINLGKTKEELKEKIELEANLTSTIDDLEKSKTECIEDKKELGEAKRTLTSLRANIESQRGYYDEFMAEYEKTYSENIALKEKNESLLQRILESQQ